MNRNGTPKNLKPFSTENQPDNRGRRPSILKNFAKDFDLSAADLRMVLKNLLFDMPLSDLDALMTDSEQPTFVRVLARAIKEDFVRGRMATLDWALDRIYGTSIAKAELRVTPRQTEGIRLTENERLTFRKNMELLFPKIVPYAGETDNFEGPERG